MMVLGTIIAVDNTKGLTVLIDGEDVATTKKYSYLASYVPTANDRVLIEEVSGSYVILGKLCIDKSESGVAQFATNATNASHAAEADHATDADHATTANNATVATSSQSCTGNAATATYATSAGHATSANNATRAVRADTASNASYADEAAYADEADYATTAGTASSVSGKVDAAKKADKATVADGLSNQVNKENGYLVTNYQRTYNATIGAWIVTNINLTTGSHYFYYDR